MIMFADDIMNLSISREHLEENLDSWRYALERRGIKGSRSKTRYMCKRQRCNWNDEFIGNRGRDGP